MCGVIKIIYKVSCTACNTYVKPYSASTMCETIETKKYHFIHLKFIVTPLMSVLLLCLKKYYTSTSLVGKAPFYSEPLVDKLIILETFSG